MTFGRPLMIDKSFTTAVPSLIDDEYLRADEEGTQPSDAPTTMSLCCFSCDLFAILADVLTAFYSLSSSTNFEAGRDLQDMQTKVLALNGRLDRFFEALPQHLKFDAGAMSSSPNIRLSLQRDVLFCRYGSQC